jgi:DNA-directed RNA polymerase specialized sigma24 family protein
MREAIAALPPRMQAVYRRHLFDGIDYRAIASERRIDVREVERLIAQSIVLIDRYGGSSRKRSSQSRLSHV